MSRTVHLVNDWPGILDLSPLTDVENRRLVLQPKGMNGSIKEVQRDIAEHPHVQSFVRAKWLHVEAIEAAASPPALEPVHPNPPEIAEPVVVVADSPPTVAVDLTPPHEAPEAPPPPEVVAPVAEEEPAPVSSTAEGRSKKRR
jgi:hypothetical protein